jgi:RNA polymerase sigma-70 factor (ECF subfamily)
MLRDRAENDPAADAAVPVTELDDASLIDRVAARDLQAFDALYRAYHTRLARFLGRLTRRAGLVEEVLNDTMLVVWNRADSYNGRSKVSTWIFAIAYRKTLKALQRLDEAVEDEQPEQRASPDAGPEQQLGQQQRHDALTRALGALTPEHRAVIELTYFHDVGYGEIAQIVGCPVDTVKTRMFHARRRLRALLSGEAEDWL